MQVHHDPWVGTSFLLIGERRPTYVGFLFIGGRKPTNVSFIMETTRKGHLIPGAVVFSIRHSRILHSKFFSLKKPFPSDNWRGGRNPYHMKVIQRVVHPGRIIHDLGGYTEDYPEGYPAGYLGYKIIHDYLAGYPGDYIKECIVMDYRLVRAYLPRVWHLTGCRRFLRSDYIG